jgi:hypothetical protein
MRIQPHNSGLVNISSTAGLNGCNYPALLDCKRKTDAKATAGPSTAFGAKSAPNSAQDDSYAVISPLNSHQKIYSHTIRIRQPRERSFR